MAESRAELLDTDAIIDDIIARKGPRRYTEGLSEENWEEARSYFSGGCGFNRLMHAGVGEYSSLHDQIPRGN